MAACSLLATVVAMLTLQGAATGQSAPPVATFKATVDLVRVAAIVRDQKGRFVQDLSIRDFTYSMAATADQSSILDVIRVASPSRCCSTRAAAWSRG